MSCLCNYTIYLLLQKFKVIFPQSQQPPLQRLKLRVVPRLLLSAGSSLTHTQPMPWIIAILPVLFKSTRMWVWQSQRVPSMHIKNSSLLLRYTYQIVFHSNITYYNSYQPTGIKLKLSQLCKALRDSLKGRSKYKWKKWGYPIALKICPPPTQTPDTNILPKTAPSHDFIFRFSS